MRVLVCGGREYSNTARVDSALDAVHAKHNITLIIEGGARGADRLGREWAKSRRVPFVTEDAEWKKYGAAAGSIRNAAMLVRHKPEAVVAFHGNSGTADMVAKARAAGVPVWEVPDPRPRIWVFGSNLAGRHGKGAAKYALEHYGAVYGQGSGMQGSSYAIPTKDALLRPLPMDQIAAHVETFKAFAARCPSWDFEVTPVGCGLAGYKPEQIGPMFTGAPANCLLPDEFKPYIKGST